MAILALIFIVLSIFSFLKSRGQVTPDTVSFGPYQAADGKRVFQAYNCMGCHTMVGNGAYLGPDLTEEYKHAGPAWLAAFLPSAGGWPTTAAVRAQLQDPNQSADAGTDSIDAYLKKFPGAAERIERRGGGTTMMPNLPLTKDEIGQLIAYLKYTSAMNTEGWPPKVEVDGFDRRVQLAHGVVATAQAAPAPTTAAPVPAADPVAHGAQLVKDNGCVACHAADDKKLVGPGWGGLYNSKVSLADGSTVTADDAYLRESILQPNAKIVAGYPTGVMPAYGTLLKDDEVNAIVAYLHSLEKQ
ncbi:cytochrome C [Rhodanobacter thiooxydans]|uniref:Cytochrome C n=1 Tax=Rhodanobacter thiooxydans TaxID=416169 RepID=A0A154QF23_9GAMM|nr:nitric-oxide reductase subunit C [Rhodanobacter thiooxydans LCS2]KZC22515.1 cytochrome C [Rhodanobacter thiooxydans]